MCWKTNHLAVKRIAETDIPVQKVLSVNTEIGNITSPMYIEFEWEVGKVYECKIGKVHCSDGISRYAINEGFHSSEKLNHDCQCNEWVNGGSKHLFIAGFWDAVCDAVIPAGSEYYLNEDGDYVSNKMKIIKVGEPIRKFFRFFLKD